MKLKKRKIYFLPSLMTIANLFFGFLSITYCINKKYSWAAFWIILSAVMDALDGLIARSTHTQSDFGMELDSLADLFSFGGAPSILLYLWGLKITGRVGILFSFILLTAGALRLARYNIRSKIQSDRKYYLGLPIPSGALLICSIVLFHSQPIETKLFASLLALAALFVAFCMVSTLKYRNFMNFNFRKRIDIKTALVVAIILGSLVFYRRPFLLIFFSLNVLSAPSVYLYGILKNKIQKKLKLKEVSS